MFASFVVALWDIVCESGGHIEDKLLPTLFSSIIIVSTEISVCSSGYFKVPIDMYLIVFEVDHCLLLPCFCIYKQHC